MNLFSSINSSGYRVNAANQEEEPQRNSDSSVAGSGILGQKRFHLPLWLPLAEVLTLAEPQYYVCVLVNDGPPMRPLLHSAATRDHRLVHAENAIIAKAYGISA